MLNLVTTDLHVHSRNINNLFSHNISALIMHIALRQTSCVINKIGVLLRREGLIFFYVPLSHLDVYKITKFNIVIFMRRLFLLNMKLFDKEKIGM